MVNGFFQWLLLSLLLTGQRENFAEGIATSDNVMLAGSAHPYYVSVTEIEYSSKDKEIGVAVKIFADDFENTLRQQYKVSLDLLNPARKEQNSGYIKEYITRHLRLQLNGKVAQPVFLGYEAEGESVWTYFSVPSVSEVIRFQADITLLYEFQKEQINLVFVKLNGERKAFRLVNPESTVKL